MERIIGDMMEIEDSEASKRLKRNLSQLSLEDRETRKIKVDDDDEIPDEKRIQLLIIHRKMNDVTDKSLTAIETKAGSLIQDQYNNRREKCLKIEDLEREIEFIYRESNRILREIYIERKLTRMGSD